MAASTRFAVNLLSPCLKCRRQPAPFLLRQIRSVSSRYSNPSKRNFVAAPQQPSAFLDSSKPHLDAGADITAVRHPAAAYEERRQYHLRRMRFAGMGLLLSMAGLALVIYNLDLDDMGQKERPKKAGQQMDASDEANSRFQGKEVHVVGAGEGKRIVAQGQGEEIELVETGTSSVPHFPRTIYLPPSSDASAASVLGTGQQVSPVNAGNVDDLEEYTLVGLGIRTVMWIQVYVVGMYIRTKDISALQRKLIHHVNPMASTLVPAEKEDLKKKLLDPMMSREIWTELLQVPGLKTAWRVSPTRNTDFGHLRDGFVTGINKRTQETRQLLKVAETEYDTDEFGQAVQEFKGIFSGGKAPKGSILIMLRDEGGALQILYQDKPGEITKKDQMEKLGSVADERIARLIWLGYLGGDKVSSEATRKGVVDGCVGFAGRPVGSAETMVT